MIIVDVETTGIDTKENSFIEIGAIDFENPQNRFYVDCQARPGCKISDYALKLNGHTEESLYNSSKPSQREALDLFTNWLKTCKGDITIIGENPRFDLDFLIQGYRDCKISSPFGYRTIDLHSLVVDYHLRNNLKVPVKANDKGFNSSAINSDFIMSFVGIPREPHPHNGLNGAIYEAEAFSRIVYGKKLLSEFAKQKIP